MAVKGESKMKGKDGLDPNNLTIIPESEVPKKGAKGRDWRTERWNQVFKLIPPGKALVLEKGLLPVMAIRSALRTRQANGNSLDFYVVQKTINGVTQGYLVHEKEKVN